MLPLPEGEEEGVGAVMTETTTPQALLEPEALKSNQRDRTEDWVEE